MSSLLHPLPLPASTENCRNEMTTTRKKGKTAKSGPNVMVGPKQVPVAKSNKPMKPKQPSQPKDLVAPFNPNSHPSRSPISRQPSAKRMCGTHLKAPHIRPISHLWDSSLAGCAQNHHVICSRIWQHGLGGRYGPNFCGWPAGITMVTATGSRNWIISSDMGLICAC